MKKLLFVLAIICLIIPSCKKTPVIVLSVDKSEISANGEDLAKFKVICNGEDDVTKECHIFFSDSKKELGSVTFSTTEAKIYSFYATYKDATSNSVTVKANEVVIEEEEEEEEEKESPIILSVSANSIVANGIDIVEFTVRQDDADITAETEIFINDNKIEGNKFSTTTAGSYKAYAKKGELKSNEISITATAVPEPEKPITLSASKTTIQANGVDIVTFTVKQDNKDVTSSSTFFVDGNKINGNQFTTTVAGSHTAYAKKNDIVSNEITIVAEAVEGGKTIVFADGVTLSSGWYDVNKLRGAPSGDVNMCWAASASNIIQWWQDRYVAAGNVLPSGAVTGPGTKTYTEGYKYNLALMELYRDMWNNEKGGSTDHGVIWYFEGRNVQKYASAGSIAQPLNSTSGGYYSSVWNQILPKVYHEYKSDLFPSEFSNLISKEYNNYNIWGNGSGLQGDARLKKFSDLVVEFIDRGVVSLVISLNSNGGLLHATTLWGYEIDNATGMITKLWITDSDDMHQSGSGDPTQQKLQEYSVSFDGSKVKLSGAPYGSCWAMSLIPVSGYNSAK